MIPPTIGRVVLFWPADTQRSHEVIDSHQPFDAHVCYVHSDTLINIAGYDHSGEPFKQEDTFLWQGEGLRPDPPFAEWMPYQKAQAAKHEAEKAKEVAHGPAGQHAV